MFEGVLIERFCEKVYGPCLPKGVFRSEGNSG